MTRFVFRNTVTSTPNPSAGGRGGAQITAYEAAQFMNAIQELAASTRLGIPALFKSNARNHYEHDATAGINVSAGSFSEWPKEAGLAATRDMDLIAEFARIMAEEWTSIGLRAMYGYMADLSTEPRWYRNHETFTEDADLAANIMTVLVKNLQGEKLNRKSVAYLVGNRSFQKKAELAQRKSIVLLQHKTGLLPLPMPKAEQTGNRGPAGFRDQQTTGVAHSDRDSVKLYTMGMNADVVGDDKWSNFTVVSGDYDTSKAETRPKVPEGTDYAIIRVVVGNERNRERRFGGPAPDELDVLSFSEMAKAKSWTMTPSLEDIQGVMKEVGADKTILAIRFRQPYVLDKASGLRNAGAILATFGVSDAAIMDVLTGNFKPSGKLPFALAKSAKAIVKQAPDAPGYEKADTLFPFGHGLSY